MSRFFSDKYASLEPYTPGEQPRQRTFIKLNTNESPFPPSPKAIALAQKAAMELQLYSDPECTELVEAACRHFGVNREEILFTNGSDEILNFAFMAFCDWDHPAVFPDITYGFYKVFAELNGVPWETIPLDDLFRVRPEDYFGAEKTIFLANPNAPTGRALTLREIRSILDANPDTVVVIDEAYVDFGASSAVKLIRKYDNLLVTQTMSKSRSLAGGRLGFGIGCRSLIADLNTIKYSTNPYNINRMTMAAGIGALEDTAYFEGNCQEIIRVRKQTAQALKKLGFRVVPSQTNFLFAAAPSVSGLDFYQKMKEKGILIRHFETPRLKDYNRITIGTEQQMEAFLAAAAEILEEAK